MATKIESQSKDYLSADVDIIVLDDERYFADYVSDVLRDKSLKVDTFYNPEDVMRKLSLYNVNTKIIMDNCFQNGITGENFARELYAKGFEKICLLTGVINILDVLLKYPEGIKVILKSSDDFENELLHWCE